MSAAMRRKAAKKPKPGEHHMQARDREQMRKARVRAWPRLSSSEINPRSPVRKAAPMGPARSDIAARMRSLTAWRNDWIARGNGFADRVGSRRRNSRRQSPAKTRRLLCRRTTACGRNRNEPGATGAGSGRNVPRSRTQPPGKRSAGALVTEMRICFGCGFAKPWLDRMHGKENAGAAAIGRLEVARRGP